MQECILHVVSAGLTRERFQFRFFSKSPHYIKIFFRGNCPQKTMCFLPKIWFEYFQFRRSLGFEFFLRSTRKSSMIQTTVKLKFYKNQTRFRLESCSINDDRLRTACFFYGRETRLTVKISCKTRKKKTKTEILKRFKWDWARVSTMKLSRSRPSLLFLISSQCFFCSSFFSESNSVGSSVFNIRFCITKFQFLRGRNIGNVQQCSDEKILVLDCSLKTACSISFITGCSKTHLSLIDLISTLSVCLSFSKTRFLAGCFWNKIIWHFVEKDGNCHLLVGKNTERVDC